jgi:Phage integrase, N-terminal SAM-like domain
VKRAGASLRCPSPGTGSNFLHGISCINPAECVAVGEYQTAWVVRYRDPLPREHTFDRKSDAVRFERYVRHQLDTDQYLDTEMAKVTFRAWAERWWLTIENSERAPSTISGYESALRIQVLPYLGERRLRTLRRIDMEEWLGELRSVGYSNSPIHAARTVPGMVLSSALDARIIASNPLVGIRLPMARAGHVTPLPSSRSSRWRAPSIRGGVPSCSSWPIADFGPARLLLSAQAIWTTEGASRSNGP